MTDSREALLKPRFRVHDRVARLRDSDSVHGGLPSVLLVAVVGVDALAVVASFVGFCLGALVAGLVAYNLLMVALLWLPRR